MVWFTVAPFVCQHHFPIADSNRNDDIFSRAVWNLLIILSNWTGFSCGCGCGRRYQGLTLELGVYSPSDSKHTFRDFRLEHDYPYQDKKDLERDYGAYRRRAARLKLNPLNDPSHGWVDGHRDAVCLGSKQRIMGMLAINLSLPEFSAFSQTFPKVEIVTGLLIRRQFYRKITAKSLSKLLREAFTCLRWFRHEGWHDVSPRRQLGFERSMLKVVFLAAAF